MFVRSLIGRSSNHNYSFLTQRVFTQDWLNSYATACLYTRLTEFLLNCLYLVCIAFYIIRLNALEGECFCLREILINANKQVACSVVVVYCTLLLAVYFLINLFISNVNKTIIFVFEDFVYHSKNTISIFVTIFMFQIEFIKDKHEN